VGIAQIANYWENIYAARQWRHCHGGPRKSYKHHRGGHRRLLFAERGWPGCRGTRSRARSRHCRFVIIVQARVECVLAHYLVADGLKEAGIHCFGPSALAARIETSKAWAKAFMSKYHIPTAAYNTFKDFEAAEGFIRKQQSRLVVKASGLAAGKGVFVTSCAGEAVEAARKLLVDKIFGDAGSEIVVEEYLEGQEISVLAFTDGATVVTMPPARDHKRAFDFNAGPNTGGMGSIAPVPGVSRQLLNSIEEQVLQAAVDGLQHEGCKFVGVLFAGIMLTGDGPRVLEFNCRFGDPETQVLLPLLQSDLRDVMHRCVTGTLAAGHVKFRNDAFAVTVVVASEGYPGTYTKNVSIPHCPPAPANALIFHAGTTLTASGELLTSGGRVFAVSAVAPTLRAALTQAYETTETIPFQGSWFRRDIGGSYHRPYCKTQPLRIGVLGSTNGTDLPPILDAIRVGELRGAQVVVVISNKADAGILQQAREWDIAHEVIPSLNKSREVSMTFPLPD
jgi:phosphoribosylamine--glycine ligase